MLRIDFSPRTTHPRDRWPTSEISNRARVFVGYQKTCVLRASGVVVCAGDRMTDAQAFGASDESKVNPKALSGTRGVIQVALGGMSACALRANASIGCWVYRGSTDLPENSASDAGLRKAPPRPALLSDATALSFRDDHGRVRMCAVRQDRTVWCSAGERSDGVAPQPVRVDALADVVGISVGESHNCAVHHNGTVSCWGRAYSGEIGTIASGRRFSPEPIVW